MSEAEKKIKEMLLRLEVHRYTLQGIKDKDNKSVSGLLVYEIVEDEAYGKMPKPLEDAFEEQVKEFGEKLSPGQRRLIDIGRRAFTAIRTFAVYEAETIELLEYMGMHLVDIGFSTSDQRFSKLERNLEDLKKQLEQQQRFLKKNFEKEKSNMPVMDVVPKDVEDDVTEGEFNEQDN